MAPLLWAAVHRPRSPRAAIRRGTSGFTRGQPPRLRKANLLRIAVNGLPAGTSDADLERLLSAYGAVRMASVLKDEQTGQLLGTGIAEMPNRAEAEAAIRGLDRSELDGSTLTVRRGARNAPGRRRHGEE